LGQYYLGRGDLAAATRELEAERVASPRSRRVYALLAECYAAAGRAEAAAEARARYQELANAPEE
jgi:predicted Zn-dependent protease